MFCIDDRIEIDDWTGLIDGAGPTQVGQGSSWKIDTISSEYSHQCALLSSKVFDLAESLVVMFAKRIEHHHAHRFQTETTYYKVDRAKTV